MSRGAVVAEDELRERSATLFAGIPPVQECRHLIDPRGHVRVSASRKHYDALLVGCSDFLNQLILARRKAEGSTASLAFDGVGEAGKQQHNICLCRIPLLTGI